MAEMGLVKGPSDVFGAEGDRALGVSPESSSFLARRRK